MPDTGIAHQSRTNTASVGTIQTFESPREGPELQLQAAVCSSLAQLLDDHDLPTWAGVALPVGGGIPDVLAASYHPCIETLSSLNLEQIALMSYLSSVRSASSNTISKRTNRVASRVLGHLEELLSRGVVVKIGEAYRLGNRWKCVLTDLVAIEVKVSDWRRGLQQASRNRLFAERSYLAVPLRTAKRIKHDSFARSSGIGILGISEDGSIQIVKRSRRQKPRIWSYYYRVARAVSTGAKSTQCPTK